jgi:hypothetical protein
MFLTVRPCSLFYEFCKKLKSEMYDIYIVIDDNNYNYNIPYCDYDINIIKLDRKSDINNEYLYHPIKSIKHNIVIECNSKLFLQICFIILLYESPC